VAYNHLVERVMVFSYDSDIVPALKTARINGLQVIISWCPDIMHLDEEIKHHADFIRKKKFAEIFSK